MFLSESIVKNWVRNMTKFGLRILNIFHAHARVKSIRNTGFDHVDFVVQGRQFRKVNEAVWHYHFGGIFLNTFVLKKTHLERAPCISVIGLTH